MKASDIDYFPMNRALALTHTISDDEKRLNELRTMVNSLQVLSIATSLAIRFWILFSYNALDRQVTLIIMDATLSSALHI